MSPRRLREIEERLEALGWTVLSGYGLAQTRSLFGGNRPDARSAGSVGRRGITARPAALGAAGHGDRQYRNALRGNRPYCHAGWKTSVRSSILSLGNASGGVVGSLNDVCGMKRARPSVMVSQHFNNSASSARISGA